MIRVQSKDAKFIGSSIGGAQIVVRDATTGEILAEGLTRGSTGDTDKIMKEPRTRGKQLTDDKTAGFLARLTIEKPVFVTVDAIAPVNKKQASVRSSTQLWVIPGKNITGDGVILEIPGFVVDILSPQTHERIGAEEEIKITANVVMMCGCPVTPGGIWNSDNYDVSATITKDSGESNTIKLKADEKASTFSAKTSLTAGNYEVVVYSFDPATGNTGLDKTNIIVQ
ncbi:hypothetical protein LZ575_06610 [Antarcticibacterium sp. 1MA-6-2]|uniref:hypothetical protein n=1 Tax=Antarcticibacterium sp. 1MA-6-2 TaxID=2908210 RepID=UPI001F48AFD6|nr:hypothetical protein [Antarcticibacterium sp. 1MA-6-2]UJH92229.1 hypothetical protein LZ575_06610 [Antarcticibacterium sp. 1MA-6-2]